MKRIILFLGTNIAVLLVLAVAGQLLGLDGHLDAQGGIDFTSLLVFAAIVGFSGSLISLATSKTAAKWATGARVIGQPGSSAEQWLVATVQRHAQAAGIGMPEVAVCESPAPNAFATGARRDHALVAVSTGLLQTVHRQEAEAVLGHR